MTEYSNKEEQEYLNLCKYIIENGENRMDRTGTGTKAIFAPPQLRFSLKNNKFPLMTTKRLFTKAIIYELLWFISGKTDSNILSKQGVHIWDGNGSKEYLSKIGLKDRREGDLGPVYGFQWRHFGAKYINADHDYTGQGVDQLAQVIDKIKNSPYDRRIILSAWNPADLNKMALPPCHMFAQFYVSFGQDNKSKPKLSCLLYQRSCDMGLGVPFNIASYALLTIMIAHVCDMEPGEFIHTMGDTHVYNDHIDALKELIIRKPREFPTLKLARKVENIDDFKFEDFIIENYNPLPKVQMKMSV